jgi:hypothetical protein
MPKVPIITLTSVNFPTFFLPHLTVLQKPAGTSEADVFLFFKMYDPLKEALTYGGRAYLPCATTVKQAAAGMAKQVRMSGWADGWFGWCTLGNSHGAKECVDSHLALWLDHTGKSQCAKECVVSPHSPEGTSWFTE